jgi:uncharacterized membrane protein YkgB
MKSGEKLKQIATAANDRNRCLGLLGACLLKISPLSFLIALPKLAAPVHWYA